MTSFNKKGGLLSFTFWIIMFIALWALWLGSFLSEWGLKNITDNGLVGIEALFYANMNLWIFLTLLVTIFLGIKYGGTGA